MKPKAFCPKILLIGVGRFGKRHLRILYELERDGVITLMGAVVKTKKSQKHIERQYGIPVFRALTHNLLVEADAVDIVTPSTTHYALVKRCLRYCHVFVEKPLAEHPKKARNLEQYAHREKKLLMVGHIYRSHPITEQLKLILKRELASIHNVVGKFISPLETWRGESASFEELHWFDILDDVLKKSPRAIWANGTKFLLNVDLRYPGGIDARLELGWRPKEKIREMTFYGKKKILHCDFKTSTITVYQGKRRHTRHYPLLPEPLEKELATFVRILKDKNNQYPDGLVGARIVDIAYRAEKSAQEARRRIAIIGGGIFGMTSALVLSKYFQVTVFERNNDILEEASYKNQYRHHMGYHYPRSVPTVQEAKEAKISFENMYGAAIMRNFPSYYAVDKKHSLTSAKKFLSFCKSMGLPYRMSYPDADFLNRSSVSVSVQTPEAAYDYEKLKRIIKKRIRSSKNIVTRLNAKAINTELTPIGKKVLTYQYAGRTKKTTFDYIINATYANRNAFCGWMDFFEEPMLFNFKEIVLIKLPTKKKLAVTIIDGPFATFLPTKKLGYFTFGDVPLSVHRTRVGKQIDINSWSHNKYSRWTVMQKRSAKRFPILKDAKYINSMFVVLPIYPQTQKNADRPTDVTSHGFGCWSILSGKIITAVSAAERILSEIQSLSNLNNSV